MQNRRLFLEAMGVAGVGAATGGFATRALAQHAPPPGRNQILEQLTRELGQIGNSLLTHGARGEHGRALAMHLRLLAAQDLDAEIQGAVRRSLAEHGREHLLGHDVNPAEVRRALESAGIDPARLPFDLASRRRASRAEREAALGRLQREGLSPLLRQLAASVDRSAAHADARENGLRLVALRAAGECQSIQAQLILLEFAIAIACLAVVLASCALLLAAVMILELWAWSLGC